ncbi:NAD-dependent epimerase/dehydratase family protein [Cyanobium sp. NIES-981]|uniref:NAD-dependent epimerase/dehydratase family protein n=1 Tax=Cyanobium sp. NIES-981 TaxID=1851505 RepID=UPI0007DD46FE|nr:NAD-dependent epimerase/dehydratase family protein [Cyanobium sp. NIES-981]SBO42487.1 NAD-dependent epimerase/dehydratase [Cyanobium sp. NIES-981]
MRITIIGCGWLGLALARHWRGRHALVLTTTTPERLPELEALGAEAALVQGNDRSAMARALAQAEVVVLTLAPRGDRQVDADAYASTYLSTCRSLLEVLPELPQLRQIVYTSSCGVYGDAAGGWIDETTPPQPRDGHATVLLQAEALLQRATAPRGAGMPAPAVAVLRLGALHGPGRELGPRLARLAGSQRPGDGILWSNWIHQQDAVAAIDAVVEQGFSGLLNVVDGRPATLRQLVERACAVRALAPVTWGADDPLPQSPSPPSAGASLPNRRIGNQRLLALGVTPMRAGVLEQLAEG